jgi:hypothetical protein
MAGGLINHRANFDSFSCLFNASTNKGKCKVVPVLDYLRTTPRRCKVEWSIALPLLTLELDGGEARQLGQCGVDW